MPDALAFSEDLRTMATSMRLGTEAMQGLLQETRNDQKLLARVLGDALQQLATMRAELKRASEEVERLRELLRGRTNGQDSVLGRFQVLEGRTTELGNRIDRLEKRWEVKGTHRWQLNAQIIQGFLALLAGMMGALFAYWLKNLGEP
jgi:chromosome segregation ATPase